MSRSARDLHIAAILCLLTSVPVQVAAQAINDDSSSQSRRETYTVHRSESPVTVDAILNEPAWSNAEIINISYEWLPGDNIPAPVETEVRICFDEDFFYISYVAFDPDPSQIRAHIRDRDSAFTDDHVGFMLDTFDDARRGFQFRLNPVGVQMDATFSELEGFEDFSWDAIWHSAAQINEEGYIVEAAIPFSSLRFPRTEDIQTWGISLFRSWPRSVRHRMRSSYTDRNMSSLLNQADKITGLQGISPGRNIEIVPTLSAIRTDERAGGVASGSIENGKVDTDPGVTMKWGVTPNLILNGTLNPDFSQVEADVAQLDVNTRFTLFFPERRPFFLEGADFFVTPMNAVFTRTISDPSAGIKLTGKEGRHAIGLFSTRDRINNLLFPANQGNRNGSYDQEVTTTVLRHRYDLGSNSTVGILYTGREANGYHNRVYGADGFLRISDTNTVNFQFLRSNTAYPDSVSAMMNQPSGSFEANAFSTGFLHQSRNWLINVNYEDFGKDFRADSGFMTQVDMKGVVGTIGHVFWGSPESWFTRFIVSMGTFRYFDGDGTLTDSNARLFLTYFGPWQSQAQLTLSRRMVLLAGNEYKSFVPRFTINAQPNSIVTVGLNMVAGEWVDFANERPADRLNIGPSLGLNLGRHLNANLSHNYQSMDVDSGHLFTANLTQLRLLYHFNVRTYVRAIVQYQTLARNPDAYLFPVTEKTRNIFTQFLFSYKINPQTVLFLGYSDNYSGGEYGGTIGRVDLTKMNRTFFMKLGYAIVL